MHSKAAGWNELKFDASTRGVSRMVGGIKTTLVVAGVQDWRRCEETQILHVNVHHTALPGGGGGGRRGYYKSPVEMTYNFALYMCRGASALLTPASGSWYNERPHYIVPGVSIERHLC